MSENQNAGPGSGEKSGAPSAETLAADLKARTEELETERKERSKLSGEHRILKDRLTELETQINSREKEEAAKSGNTEELRAKFQKEVDEAKAEAGGLRKQLHTVVLEKEVRTVAADLFVDAEDVWQLTKDAFEVQLDGKGNPVPVVKDSTLSIRDYLVKFAEKKPHLAKNSGKAGAGGGRTEDKGVNGQAGIPADIHTWSREKQLEFFAKNKNVPAPKLA